MIVDL